MSFHPDRNGVAPRTEEAVFRPALPTCFKSGMTEMQMKLEASDETEVFINRNGGLTITQDHRNGDELVVVALTRTQARLVASEIMRLDGDDSVWTPEEKETINGTSS